MKQSRQKRRVGDIFKIDLGDGSWAYGRVLKEPLVAIYDLKTSKEVPLQTIISSPVAFKVWVMNSAITKGIWPVIGNAPLTPDLEVQPPFFKRDPLSGALSITYVGGGDEIPASLEDCANLENAAVWSAEHIVDRLNDHFAGRPNKWVELLKPR